MKNQLKISKLEKPERIGDWHDKPALWVVTGPETQKFPTKKEALLWAKCRRSSNSFGEAFNKFIEVY